MTESAYHQQPSADIPAPVGCPVDHSWSPLSPAYLDDPYSAAATFREFGGAFYSEQLGYLVITSMADIDAVFTDHETFASTNVQDPVFPLDPAATDVLSATDFNPIAVMSNRPEPDHGRIRVYRASRVLQQPAQDAGAVHPPTNRRTHRLDARHRLANRVRACARLSAAR